MKSAPLCFPKCFGLGYACKSNVIPSSFRERCQMKSCKYCGKKIPENRRSNSVFCSEYCQRRAFSNHKIISERTKRLKPIRERKLAAHEGKCAICGWSAKSPVLRSNGCELHHIIPVAEGGTEEWNNIILLCPNCHRLAHSGIIARQQLIQYLVTESIADENVNKMRSKAIERVANAIF